MMTPAQEDVMMQIRELCREHFDGAVIVLGVEGDSTTDNDDFIRVLYHGGYAQAVGLAALGAKKLLEGDAAS